MTFRSVVRLCHECSSPGSPEKISLRRSLKNRLISWREKTINIFCDFPNMACHQNKYSQVVHRRMAIDDGCCLLYLIRGSRFRVHRLQRPVWAKTVYIFRFA